MYRDLNMAIHRKKKCYVVIWYYQQIIPVIYKVNFPGGEKGVGTGLKVIII